MPAETETKPDATVEQPKPDAAEVTTPSGSPSGGGEPAQAPAQPSQEPDWKAKSAELEAKFNALAAQVPNLTRGMNTAQQEAALYKRQMEALAGVQPPQVDPLETWNREAEELEAGYRFSDAAPIRSRISAEVARRASREEFQKLHQQQSQQGFQQQVAEELRSMGFDPSTADASRATGNAKAVARAIAFANDPDKLQQFTLKDIDDRKKAAEHASQLASLGGGSGGRGFPGNDKQQKPRMSMITYAALPKSRKAEIRSMARKGELDLYVVSGRGLTERMEIADPRDLNDE